MESSAGKLFKTGLSTQLEQLQGRQGEEEAVEGWSASVQRERMMRTKLTAAEKALQSASQDMNRWKAKAEKYAAIATEHAADAEDILGQSYGLLSKIKGVAVLLPDSEAKALLNRVLEEHESTVLAWHEQGVPLAKQHVPTVELADVSNCLAGMSLANTNEVTKPHGQQAYKPVTSAALPGAGGLMNQNMAKENETENISKHSSPLKDLENEVVNPKAILTDNAATSPATGSKMDKVSARDPEDLEPATTLEGMAPKNMKSLPPTTPFSFAASERQDSRSTGKAQKTRKGRVKRVNN